MFEGQVIFFKVKMSSNFFFLTFRGRLEIPQVNVGMCVSLSVCPTLCDPMDCSPPGSSVHGVLQASIPEWVLFPSP